LFSYQTLNDVYVVKADMNFCQDSTFIFLNKEL